MRARTKTEKEVMSLSRKLGEIGKRDTELLIKNTYGTCDYNDMYDRCYAVISQGKGAWQVMRYFRIDRHRNIHREVSYNLWEVMQLWLGEGGKEILVSRQRTIGYYVDTFSYSSTLDLRKASKYGISIKELPFDYIYLKSYSTALKYVADEMSTIREGIWRKTALFVLGTPLAETIMKRDLPLAVAMIEGRHTRQEDLDAVKIALRHGFDIAGMGYANYFDYIHALVYLGKDIHNPYYACPSDPMAMHDRYIARMDRERGIQRIREDLSHEEDDNKRYISWRKRFFDMEITDGTISCKVLRSVKEFYEEGKAMHHCVYSCKYYNKPYSLILSARIGSKRIETIEVDLTSYRILQCYGACDKFTIYHDRIKNLINDNMDIIKQHNKQQTKQLKTKAS